jgi:hypothetical protein
MSMTPSSYTANHKRVVRVRGRAATYTCECGAPADDWATIHGIDPANPTNKCRNDESASKKPSRQGRNGA